MSAAYLQAPAMVLPYRAGCTGKVAFPSMADANRTRKIRNMRFPPYECVHCRLWHVTSTGKLRTLGT